MLLLSAIFVVVYSLEVIPESLPDWFESGLRAFSTAIWVVFIADVAIRTALAEKPLKFLVTHPIDVAAAFVPALRPLRLLKLFSAGREYLSRRSTALETGVAVLLAALMLLYVGALAILDAERGTPEALITSFPDAIWWSFVTVTTVGYGDFYPVTGTGRLIAILLMIVGISVLGAVSAAVAGWLIPDEGSRSDSSERSGALQPQRDDIAAMRNKIDDLNQKLDALLSAQQETQNDRSKNTDGT